MRDVEIWPWSAADAVEGLCANVSRSLRREEDCFRAELKRGFYPISEERRKIIRAVYHDS